MHFLKCIEVCGLANKIASEIVITCTEREASHCEIITSNALSSLQMEAGTTADASRNKNLFGYFSPIDEKP